MALPALAEPVLDNMPGVPGSVVCRLGRGAGEKNGILRTNMLFAAGGG